MVGITASPVSAEMVKLKPLRDGSAQMLKGEPVSVQAPAADPNADVTRGVGFVARRPAAIIVQGDTKEDVFNGVRFHTLQIPPITGWRNALKLADIRPNPDERAVLVGQSGSGKTTLAVHLVSRLPFVLAVDPKHDLGADARRSHLKGFTLVDDPRLLGKLNPMKEGAKIQLRPHPEFQTFEWYDSVYWWAYERQNTHVYTDEVNLILKGRDPPDGFRACVTCGRGRGVGMTHSTQRPSGIPQICISESQHVFAFILQNDYDRKAVVAAGVDDIIRSKPIHDPFWLYYKGPRVKGTRLLHLDLRRK